MSSSVCRSTVWFGGNIVSACFIEFCFMFIEVVLFSLGRVRVCLFISIFSIRSLDVFGI